ncbi:MAG: sigma-70 family RNA polymerase sigma factor [Pirellula sp.]|jgi:RNA polymerase sigma-70 factor (ECF subfamily)|nr:sigma-70 family RNA polymerase sigma factor [Pirellula sp.]
MSDVSSEQILVESIRAGNTDAWQQFIDRFEGRLLAYVGARLMDRSHAEDIVQETLIGFVNSLPNYDCSRSLESYLFSIAAYKLTDHLRREGRRPATQFASHGDTSDGAKNVPAAARGVSSVARSVEQRSLEESALASALKDQISKWKSRDDYQKLKCIEMLFVAGINNKDAAKELGITEQQVANYKSDFINRTRSLIARQATRENFPELAE